MLIKTVVKIVQRNTTGAEEEYALEDSREITQTRGP